LPFLSNITKLCSKIELVEDVSSSISCGFSVGVSTSGSSGGIGGGIIIPFLKSSGFILLY
jgi:hypothetical protein